MSERPTPIEVAKTEMSPRYPINQLWRRYNTKLLEIEKIATVEDSQKRKYRAISPSSIEKDLPRILSFLGLEDLPDEQEIPPKAAVAGTLYHLEDNLFSCIRQGTVRNLVGYAFPATDENQLYGLHRATTGPSNEMQTSVRRISKHNKEGRKRLYDLGFSVFGMTPLGSMFKALGLDDPRDWHEVVSSDWFHEKGKSFSLAWARECLSKPEILIYSDEAPSFFEVPVTINHGSCKLKLQSRFDSITISPFVEVGQFKSSVHEIDSEVKLRQTQLELFTAEIFATRLGKDLLAGGLTRGKIPFVNQYKPLKQNPESVHWTRSYDGSKKKIESESYSFDGRTKGDNRRRAEFSKWLQWYSHALWLMEVAADVAKLLIMREDARQLITS